MKKTVLLLLSLLLLAPLTMYGASNNAQDISKLKKSLEPYIKHVATQQDWLTSRLQMYWATHATDVYVNGETFSHPGGERAPEPTVKFNGTRSTASQYNRPKLENVVPYDDDSTGSVTYINRATGKMERTNPNKTGCNIANVNQQILSIARDAATVYAATGDTVYARLALPVLRTFLLGIYYRHVPVDLNHGQQQTLVGYTTFEVIHEDAINRITDMYPTLRPLLSATDQQRCDDALRHWAENIIANGVPHNNWDLFQAEFIARIALVLQPDSSYADGHGRQYYLDYIVNRSSVRQWNLKKLAAFGFGSNPVVWYESPGYSTTVVGDFCDFANRMDRDAHVDVFAMLPQLTKAVANLPQYLFPNRMICGFGDTHPNYLNTKAAKAVLDYAERHQRTALADSMRTLIAAIAPTAPVSDVSKWVTPMFYAPNVSWLVQRTGMDARHSLMVSLNGSLGNHQHANGLSMELFGKGYVLGPDAGIGMSLYSGLDYAEYYSQMPAHNTVVVDGVSSYPVMMSQHAFHVVDSAVTSWGSYSVLYFREPETNALQQRTTAIVNHGARGGYYVDVFRSHRADGNDQMHDYFYHNLGQTLSITDSSGREIAMQPTTDLAFAGGHLYAYSYLYDKYKAPLSEPLCIKFTVNQTNEKMLPLTGRNITMSMYVPADTGRTLYKVLSPVNLEYERMPNQPYNIKKQPVLTVVMRQQGEAWHHPFAAVYEPSSSLDAPIVKHVEWLKPQSKSGDAAGIRVTLSDGSTDYIFSSPVAEPMRYGKIKVRGRFAVVHADR